MATLSETPEWVAGIYQIEEDDPVLGGAPNEATKAGLTNIPAAQLARRTRWLYDLMQQSGVGFDEGPVVTSLNDLTAGGNYVATIAAAGNPVPGGNTYCMHVAGADASNAMQFAVSRIAGRAFIRRRNAGAWTPWVEVITAANVQETPVDGTAGRLMPVGAFGLGATAAERAADCNAVARAGQYMIARHAVNSPNSAFRWTLLQSNGELGSVSQVAIGLDTDRVCVRRKYEANPWGVWRDLWAGEATEQSFGGSGYQRLPSGLMLQWGIGNIPEAGAGYFPFPIAFRTSAFRVFVCDTAVSPGNANAQNVSIGALTAAGFNASAVNMAGEVSTTGFVYMALGI